MSFIAGMQGWFNLSKLNTADWYINKTEEKHHRIILVHTKKNEFDKIQHLFIIKFAENSNEVVFMKLL
jgi:hypothetical protein